MQKPIIIIPEVHLDALAKQATLFSLPLLKELGFDTYSLEVPFDFTLLEIINHFNEGTQSVSERVPLYEATLKARGAKFTSFFDLTYEELEKLLCDYSTDKSPQSLQLLKEFTHAVIQLPAMKLTLSIFWKMLSLGGAVVGADISKDRYPRIDTLNGIKNVLREVHVKHTEREASFFANLLILQKIGSGIIFTVGAKHLENLLLKFEDQALLSEIIVLHPYSQFNKIDPQRSNAIAFTNPKLKGKVNFFERALSSEKDIPNFHAALCDFIKPVVASYYKDIQSPVVALKLSSVTQLNFQAKQRQSGYIDCVHYVKDEEDVGSAVAKLHSLGIFVRKTTKNNNCILCVPEVNDFYTAKTIEKLAL